MRIAARSMLAFAALLGSTALVAQESPPHGSSGPRITAIKAGRLIADPRTDTGRPALIIVGEGRIRSVLAIDAPVPEGATLVDLSGQTVLPGLIDLHTHLTGDPGDGPLAMATITSERSVATGVKNARLTAQAGFTTVRDLGASPEAIFALRDSIRAGEVPGPRVIASGKAVSIIGGHGDISGFKPAVNKALSGGNTCTGALECAARVREFSRGGSDVIKFTATGGVLSQQSRGMEAHFTPEEMRAIVSTAHSLGLRTAAHAHGDSGIRLAAEAGVTSIDHGTFVTQETLKIMKARGTYYVPTLMATQGLYDRIGKGVYTPVVEAKAKVAAEAWGRGLAAAVRLGVPIGFGTDSGVFEHGRNAEEFHLMVEKGGMTPRAALVAATTTAAQVLGLSDEIGTIAPGKSADIVAVTGDPLTDPRVLEKMRYVMAAGHPVALD